MNYSVRFDYLAPSDQVYISNNLLNDKQWNDFYSFICDYLPVNEIKYSERSIVFSWRLFLSITRFLITYFKANASFFKPEYTDEAKRLLYEAKKYSYSSALSLPSRGKDEIISILKSKGFIRPLTPNQEANLVKISNLPGAATFSVPGAGKTTEALAFFFLNSNPNDKLLVVAPKNAFGSWDIELVKCIGEGTGDEFVRLRGKDNIGTQLSTSPRFSIITYDQIILVKDSISHFLTANNVFMFLDESHRIKGGSQAKRAEAILDIAYLPRRKLVMSGTPMPQSEKDLLPQFTFLYPTKEVHQEDVVDLFQPIYVRTTKGQLGIPEPHRNTIKLKMPKLQREIYSHLRSEIKRQLNPALSDISRYGLKRIGKCVMKIMEFVSNPSLLATDMNYIFDQRVANLLTISDGPKIDYVCKRAHELANQNKKVIIWSCFVQNVELLALRLSDLGAEYIHGKVDAGDDTSSDTREGKIKRFHNDPNCMVLVANPAACSEGISLHMVCHNAIYLDRSFNAAHYLQSEDRIHRLGITVSPEIEMTLFPL